MFFLKKLKSLVSSKYLSGIKIEMQMGANSFSLKVATLGFCPIKGFEDEEKQSGETDFKSSEEETGLGAGNSVFYCWLPCNKCSNWTWDVGKILALCYKLRSTHYLKLCRLANFVRTTQLLNYLVLLR